MTIIRFYSLLLPMLLLAVMAKAGGNEDAETVIISEADRYVARAKEIAGEDFRFLSDGLVCRPAALAIPYALRNIPGFLDPEARAVKPFAAFDNLYYFGPHAVGSFVLDTGEGLILFDALNNEGEVDGMLLPGMKKFGLNPEDIKYIVITHAHFDHYGGAQYLKEKYGARIMMSTEDWDNLENDIALPYAMKAGYRKVTQPTRDIEVKDGDTLTLGNTTISFFVTPGHTPGTLSPIMNVIDLGQTRIVGMWGGNAVPPKGKELIEMQYSLDKFWGIVKERNVEALISTHPWIVGNFELHKKGIIDGKNPLNIGRDGVNRIMGIYDQCIKAQVARVNARQAK